MGNNDFQMKSEYYEWSRRRSCRLIRYVGSSEDVEIPAEVDSIEKDAFEGSRVTSLTVPDGISMYYVSELKGLSGLKRLILKNTDHIDLDLQSLMEKYPSLESVSIPAARTVRVAGFEKAQTKLPTVFIESESIRKMIGGYRKETAPPGLCLFAPWISPGMVDSSLRCVFLKTFTDHMDWYPEESQKKILDWIRKNGEKIFPLCLEQGYADLVNHLVITMDLRFSVRAYDDLVKYAEARQDVAGKAAYLAAKSRHYDLMKLSRIRETREENDFMDPSRVHAMQKIWSWSKMTDGTICLKKMKNDPELPMSAESIFIPEMIADSVVTAVSGSVFQEAHVQEVVFPEKIRTIRGKLFQGNADIEKVSFLGPVSCIPDSCFSRCKSLKSVVFSESGQWIGEKMDSSDPSREAGMGERKAMRPMLIMSKAFRECSSLKELHLSGVVLMDEAFASSGLQKIRLDHIPVIPRECFSHCTMLTEADIRGTAVIEFNAFLYCASLTDLHVSEELVSLRPYAFENCKSLRRIWLHDVRDPGSIEKMFRGPFRDLEFIQVRDEKPSPASVPAQK